MFSEQNLAIEVSKEHSDVNEPFTCLRCVKNVRNGIYSEAIFCRTLLDKNDLLKSMFTGNLPAWRRWPEGVLLFCICWSFCFIGKINIGARVGTSTPDPSLNPGTLVSTPEPSLNPGP